MYAFMFSYLIYLIIFATIEGYDQPFNWEDLIHHLTSFQNFRKICYLIYQKSGFAIKIYKFTEIEDRGGKLHYRFFLSSQRYLIENMLTFSDFICSNIYVVIYM